MVSKPPAALDVVHCQLKTIDPTANRHPSRECGSIIGAIRERRVRSSRWKFFLLLFSSPVLPDLLRPHGLQKSLNTPKSENGRSDHAFHLHKSIQWPRQSLD